MIVQMRPNFGVSVELPDIGKSELTEQKEKSVTVTVAVTKESKVFVNETPCTIEQVMPKINSTTKVPVTNAAKAGPKIVTTGISEFFKA